MRFRISLGYVTSLAVLAASANHVSVSPFYSSKLQPHCSGSGSGQASTAPIPIPIPKDVVIIKLGGSALTAKSSFETLRNDCLRITADQISAIANNRKDVQLLVAHGAGSFGHFQAKQFHLGHGGEPGSWLEGLAETRRSVVKLNGIVVDALMNAGVKTAVGVSQFPQVRTSNKRINSAGPLSDMLRLSLSGFVPVVHGDIVLDDEIKCSVCGGDRIVQWLSSDIMQAINDSDAIADYPKLRVKAVVFLTDVEGVYDRPPQKLGARLISRIEVTSTGEISLPETDLVGHDVTGGIKAKIEAAAQIAIMGVPVYIVQAGTTHAACAMAGDPPEVGTMIYRPHR